MTNSNPFMVRLSNARRVEEFLSLRQEIDAAPQRQRGKLIARWRERVFKVFPAFRAFADQLEELT